MQQPCQICGYVLDRPARFCRQCGTQLFVENEATSAATRQYAPQQPANPYDAPYQSQLAQAQPAQDNRFDNQTPDTSRLYHTPMAQNYSNYPANYQQAEAKKSGAWNWILITLLCVVLVSGIGAMVISAFRAKQRAEDLATSGRDLAADISEKVEEEVQRAIKDAQRAAEEAANSASPPPGSEASIDLDKYKYPNTTTDNQVRVLGNEILNLGTKDSYDEVKKFYQQLLGEPVIESNENDEQKLVFQSAGKPSVLVTIQPDKRHFGHLQIVVIRSHIQFPKLDSK